MEKLQDYTFDNLLTELNFETDRILDDWQERTYFSNHTFEIEFNEVTAVICADISFTRKMSGDLYTFELDIYPAKSFLQFEIATEFFDESEIEEIEKSQKL
jgi:hypothetical protein